MCHCRDSQGCERDYKLYCKCQQVYNPTRAMIGCDACDEWFHTSCVGMSGGTAEKLTKWFCQDCRDKGYGPPIKQPKNAKAQRQKQYADDIDTATSAAATPAHSPPPEVPSPHPTMQAHQQHLDISISSAEESAHDDDEDDEFTMGTGPAGGESTSRRTQRSTASAQAKDADGDYVNGTRRSATKHRTQPGAHQPHRPQYATSSRTSMLRPRLPATGAMTSNSLAANAATTRSALLPQSTDAYHYVSSRPIPTRIAELSNGMQIRVRWLWAGDSVFDEDSDDYDSDGYGMPAQWLVVEHDVNELSEWWGNYQDVEADELDEDVADDIYATSEDDELIVDTDVKPPMPRPQPVDADGNPTNNDTAMTIDTKPAVAKTTHDNRVVYRLHRRAVDVDTISDEFDDLGLQAILNNPQYTELNATEVDRALLKYMEHRKMEIECILLTCEGNKRKLYQALANAYTQSLREVGRVKEELQPVLPLDPSAEITARIGRRRNSVVNLLADSDHHHQNRQTSADGVATPILRHQHSITHAFPTTPKTGALTPHMRSQQRTLLKRRRSSVNMAAGTSGLLIKRSTSLSVNHRDEAYSSDEDEQLLYLDMLPCSNCRGRIPATQYYQHMKSCGMVSQVDPRIGDFGHPPDNTETQNQLKPSHDQSRYIQHGIPLPLPLGSHPWSKQRTSNKEVFLSHWTAEDIVKRFGRLEVPTVCGCPLSKDNSPAIAIDGQVTEEQDSFDHYCTLSRHECTVHTLWDSQWRAQIETAYYCNIRRLELIEAEIETCKERLYNRYLLKQLVLDETTLKLWLQLQSEAVADAAGVSTQIQLQQAAIEEQTAKDLQELQAFQDDFREKYLKQQADSHDALQTNAGIQNDVPAPTPVVHAPTPQPPPQSQDAINQEYQKQQYQQLSRQHQQQQQLFSPQHRQPSNGSMHSLPPHQPSHPYQQQHQHAQHQQQQQHAHMHQSHSHQNVQGSPLQRNESSGSVSVPPPQPQEKANQQPLTQYEHLRQLQLQLQQANNNINPPAAYAALISPPHAQMRPAHSPSFAASQSPHQHTHQTHLTPPTHNSTHAHQQHSHPHPSPTPQQQQQMAYNAHSALPPHAQSYHPMQHQHHPSQQQQQQQPTYNAIAVQPPSAYPGHQQQVHHAQANNMHLMQPTGSPQLHHQHQYLSAQQPTYNAHVIHHSPSHQQHYQQHMPQRMNSQLSQPSSGNSQHHQQQQLPGLMPHSSPQPQQHQQQQQNPLHVQHSPLQLATVGVPGGRQNGY